MDTIHSDTKVKSYIDFYKERGYQQLEGLPFLDIFLHNQLHILVVRYHPDMEIDKEKALQTVAKTKPLFNQSVKYGISDARAVGLHISRDANKIFKNYPTKEEANKLAILVNNLPIRLLANFFINVEKPAIPTRSFQSLEKATAWLHKT